MVGEQSLAFDVPASGEISKHKIDRAWIISKNFSLKSQSFIIIYYPGHRNPLGPGNLLFPRIPCIGAENACTIQKKT